MLPKFQGSTDQRGSVGWVSSCRAKGHLFNSRSGYTPRLRVQFPVGACVRGNQLMFLLHIDVSFPLLLPPFPLSLKISKQN